MTSAPTVGSARTRIQRARAVLARQIVPYQPRTRWAGPLISGIVLVSMLITATLRQGHQEIPGPTLLVLTLLAWLPLLFRHRSPGLAAIGAVAAEALHLIVMPFTIENPTAGVVMGAYQPVPIASMVAMCVLATRSSRLFGWIAGVSAAAVLLAVGVIAQPLSLLATDMIVFSIVVIATGTGVVVGARRDTITRREQEHREEAQRQVVAERLRIARDLHDVLAHHLTLVDAQAAVAGYLLDTNPDKAVEALVDINRHTRVALDELRATVGLLRQDSDGPDSREPVPRLDQLDRLVEGFRAANPTITVTVTGTPVPLASGTDLAAFRIAQEALTNAFKHAPGAAVHLDLAWTPERLRLRIHNTAAAGSETSDPVPGSGSGLIGMRERAQACGGTIHAGPDPTGGFLIEATLPTIPTDPTSARAR
ncbi:sensor histidine kinase [Nakamurella lactea]|uniref:sensor histidine kinase n=1 Tax=Nakamurella lactea TaxID=459515 RepID=UPI0003F4CE3E|nr:sensor histidine kinase [Nakamurella lactea]